MANLALRSWLLEVVGPAQERRYQRLEGCRNRPRRGRKKCESDGLRRQGRAGSYGAGEVARFMALLYTVHLSYLHNISELAVHGRMLSVFLLSRGAR